MKLQILLLSTLLAFPALKAEERFTPIDQKVLDVMGLSIKSDLSILGSDRDAVIARLREISTGKIDHIGTASLSADDAQIVLMRLDDEQTIQQVITQYQKYNSRNAVANVPDLLEWSHQPASIPYLASDLYLTEDATQSVNLKQGWEAVGVPARSVYSGVITLEIIKRAPEFSEEMKAWAKELLALWPKDPTKFRTLMQAWWKENKDAFKQQNYAAVHPVAASSVEATAPAPPTPTPPQEIKPSSPPPPVAQTPVAPLPTVQVQPSMGTSIPVWVYLAISIGAVAIIALWYRSRAK